MSYNALEAKIQSIPEEYLDEVSEYIEFVIFKHSHNKKMNQEGDISEFFGVIQLDEDPLEIQKEMRSEWDKSIAYNSRQGI